MSKKDLENKKYSSGQPKYKLSRLDDFANKFYQLGRAQARLSQERRKIEEENIIGAMQRIILLQAQQKVKDLISELNRRQLELLSVIGQVAPPQLPSSPELPQYGAQMGLPPELAQKPGNIGGAPPGIPFMPDQGPPPNIPPGMPPEMLGQGLPPELLGGGVPQGGIMT